MRVRQISAQLLAALAHVLDLGAIVGGTVERRIMQLFVRHRNAEARTEDHQLLVVDLLLLVGDVSALAALAQSVAFDRLRQNHRGRPRVLHRGLVGGIHLDRIVPAQSHLLNLLVAQVLHHLQQPRIGAKEVLPEIGSALDE